MKGPAAGWVSFFFLACDFWKFQKHTAPAVRGSCLETGGHRGHASSVPQLGAGEIPLPAGHGVHAA